MRSCLVYQTLNIIFSVVLKSKCTHGIRLMRLGETDEHHTSPITPYYYVPRVCSLYPKKMAMHMMKVNLVKGLDILGGDKWQCVFKCSCKHGPQGLCTNAHPPPYSHCFLPSFLLSLSHSSIKPWERKKKERGFCPTCHTHQDIWIMTKWHLACI